MSASLARRIAVAAVAIPLAVGVVYLGGWVLVGTLSLLGALGARELFDLAARRDSRALRGPGYAGAALFPAIVYLAFGARAVPALWILLGPALWFLFVLGVATARRPPEHGPLAGVAVTVLGAIYAGGLPSCLVLLRHGAADWPAWGATSLAFLPLVTTWVCDTCAMAGGAAIGGPKLAPVVSPGKTWAGTIAGAIGALAAAPLWGWLVLRPAGIDVPWSLLLACGLFAGTAGQYGDLAESLLKREARVKDSGGLFPGHGGVLDRLDSLYWTVPGMAAILAVGGLL